MLKNFDKLYNESIEQMKVLDSKPINVVESVNGDKFKDIVVGMNFPTILKSSDKVMLSFGNIKGENVS